MVIEQKEFEPIFDDTTLSMLRDVLQDDLRAVMASIPPEAARALNLIKAAIVAEDLDAARAAAHSLTGMALNFGAVRIATIAGSIAWYSPDVGTVARHVGPLECAIRETCARIELTV